MWNYKCDVFEPKFDLIVVYTSYHPKINVLEYNSTFAENILGWMLHINSQHFKQRVSIISTAEPLHNSLLYA